MPLKMSDHKLCMRDTLDSLCINSSSNKTKGTSQRMRAMVETFSRHLISSPHSPPRTGSIELCDVTQFLNLSAISQQLSWSPINRPRGSASPFVRRANRCSSEKNGQPASNHSHAPNGGCLSEIGVPRQGLVVQRAAEQPHSCYQEGTSLCGEEHHKDYGTDEPLSFD